MSNGLQLADHLQARQREDSYRHQAVEVVEHVKQAGPSTIVELIAGDVERPTLVCRLTRDGGAGPNDPPPATTALHRRWM